jgi:hypothetical protein
MRHLVEHHICAIANTFQNESGCSGHC